MRVLATAVYVTGSTHLEPGRRYAIALHGTRLQILGPTELDPSTVALDRAVEDCEARAVDGRLVVSEPHGRSGLVIAFMSVAGTTTDDLAMRIQSAARASVTE